MPAGVPFFFGGETMEEKTALITGGTSGIGLATARFFLAQGMHVAVAGRDETHGQNALRALTRRTPSPHGVSAPRGDGGAFFAGQGRGESGEGDSGGSDEGEIRKKAGDVQGEARYFPADVREAAACQNLVRDVAAAFGRIDVLVNAAGIYLEQAAEKLTEEDYARVMGTNLKGTMFMTRYALPFLRQTKGSVVNVSSDAGLHGNYLCSLYCASKGAVTLYTRAVAREAAPFGVRVNCVCPADILTPLTEAQLAAAPDREAALREMASVYPLHRVGTAEEAAAVIAFLASPAASYVTGAAWNIDGGLLA